MKKVGLILLVLALLFTAVSCAEEAKVETFSAEYEMVGTTSSGQPKTTPSSLKVKPPTASLPA